MAVTVSSALPLLLPLLLPVTLPLPQLLLPLPFPRQAQSPMEWTATSAKVHKTFHGLQRVRDIGAGEEEEEEDRITASIAAGLSNMPEENQV